MTTPLFFMSEWARTVVAVVAPAAVGEELESCVGCSLGELEQCLDVLTIFLPAGWHARTCMCEGINLVLLKLAIAMTFAKQPN